jgi:phosphotransferase system  glucose/maltose/N-acetylglucosamine-specific IIC component
MIKQLLIGCIVSGIGFGICDYFKVETFGTFMTGSIAYGIYDILTNIKVAKKDI